MKKLIRNYKVLLLLALLLFSFFSIAAKGIQLGIDFEGGTLFQLHLAEPVKDAAQMNIITSVIDKRLDFAGLRDTSVRSFGDEFVIAQIAESDPDEIQRLETLLLRQGKFEATLKGKLLFTGSDIVSISKDPALGYEIREIQDGIHEWYLPFTLKPAAARNFTEKSFHQCELVSLDTSGNRIYDCENTYFFVDRPSDAIILMPDFVYEADELSLLQGSSVALPSELDIEELIENAAVPVFIVGEQLTDSQIAQLDANSLEKRYALIHGMIDEQTRQKLELFNYEIRIIPSSEDTPWLWTATGARQVIALNEDVTNIEPYIERVEDAKIFNALQIRGAASSGDEAFAEQNGLLILLESGSLPIPIDDVSKETVSPFLGKEFLDNALLMGLLAIIVVSFVILIRYKIPKLVIPIMITTFAEIFLILGFLALIQLKLDLAAVAGIIAAVGTGVDHQIIIADEMIRGEQKGSITITGRIKKAFFIITVAAATTIATMVPIIFFGLGSGKLVGFAITIIIGVLIGVLITRPAFGEIAKYILE